MKTAGSGSNILSLKTPSAKTYMHTTPIEYTSYTSTNKFHNENKFNNFMIDST